jgi:SAM-dependent methyltransferase
LKIVRIGLLLELLARWLRRDLLVVKVLGESMLPALCASDVLLCSRSHPRLLWSIVIAEQSLAGGPTMRHIKRLTGLAGDVRGTQRLRRGFTWLEGDNSTRSTDSREWGPIPLERIVAVAIATMRANQLIDLRAPKRLATQSARTRFVDAWRDWSQGIRTRGVVRPDLFGFSINSVHTYVPTPWDIARRALDSIDISTHDVFVDYGCGRGRVLVVALRHPFRRVIGIELLPTLAADARRNTAGERERCQVIEGDAAELPLPDDATVIYMFNSFGDESLAQVATRIRESLLRRPRRLRLLTLAVDPALIESLVQQQPQSLQAGLALFTFEAGVR